MKNKDTKPHGSGFKEVDMLPTRFPDLAKPALIMAGTLLILGIALSPFAIAGGKDFSSVLQAPIFQLSFSITLLGLFVLVLALVGVHSRQAEAAGTFGLVSFVLAFSGTLLLTGTTFTVVFVMPAITKAAPGFLDAGPPTGVFVSFIAFGPTWLVYSIASLRARVLPKRAVIFLLVASILATGPILPVGLLLMGIALIWLGLKLDRRAAGQVTATIPSQSYS